MFLRIPSLAELATVPPLLSTRRRLVDPDDVVKGVIFATMIDPSSPSFFVVVVVFVERMKGSSDNIW